MPTKVAEVKTGHRVFDSRMHEYPQAIKDPGDQLITWHGDYIFEAGAECGLLPLETKPRRISPVEGYENIVPLLIKTLSEKIQEGFRITKIEKELEVLKNRVTSLETVPSIIVPIDTLHPEPYNVLKTIHAVVRPCEDDYIASFVDANVNSSGETIENAIVNLKEVIVIIYESLKRDDINYLGPGPLRQLNVLNKFIQKID